MAVNHGCVDEEITSEEENRAKVSKFQILEVLAKLASYVIYFVIEILGAFNSYYCEEYIATTILGLVCDRNNEIAMFLLVLSTLCKCTSASIREVRARLQNSLSLKMIEERFVSQPEMYLYSTLKRIIKLKSNPELQLVSFVVSYIEFVISIIHHEYYKTSNIEGESNKIFRALWLFFTSASWATIITSVCLMEFSISILFMCIYIGYVYISFYVHNKPVAMIWLNYLRPSQYFMPDEDMDSNANKDKFLTVAHILHLLEMGIIFIIWNFAYGDITPFHVTIYLIIGCHFLGEFFFIILQIRLNYIETSRQDTSSISSQPSILSLYF